VHVAEKLCKGCSGGKTHGDERWFSNTKLDSLDPYGVSSHPSLPLSVVCSCEMQATNICAPSSPVSRRCRVRERWLVALQDRTAHHSKIGLWCGFVAQVGGVENGKKDKTEMRIFVVKMGFSGRVEMPNMLSWSARAIAPRPRNPCRDQHSSSGSTM
jgi:hypothetical protein